MRPAQIYNTYTKQLEEILRWCGASEKISTRRQTDLATVCKYRALRRLQLKSFDVCLADCPLVPPHLALVSLRRKQPHKSAHLRLDFESPGCTTILMGERTPPPRRLESRRLDKFRQVKTRQRVSPGNGRIICKGN